MSHRKAIVPARINITKLRSEKESERTRLIKLSLHERESYLKRIEFTEVGRELRGKSKPPYELALIRQPPKNSIVLPKRPSAVFCKDIYWRGRATRIVKGYRPQTNRCKWVGHFGGPMKHVVYLKNGSYTYTLRTALNWIKTTSST